ncbi:MAG: hypothetical protein UR34_C0005G0015 [candidate division WS6 bacterium GW2011_GWC1_33_20]|uniref:Uncharacterized protein n=2 Tax=Candidatus Dojkabacteria TaxID=74243 RepID=A0A0G0AUS5_9BACT|nr:MAG: hypothetical protein UR34_C0005G0015 [candidate division WS6 bacterium GW2011_GWC1_33_20]KKP45752.1 MAG: hypothetical protein UR36_C0004G0013 [candidate division WS6 bacterium GW2011_GWF1_33_233]KKP55086.1 MAG: hypothetical protein UR47_C0005G0015 [candidate division WS6 bacterium GW2011_GWB1_33_6]KKP57079.1 MAG: hypothetical protein UR49_C0003G0013 [candidate division WS6 bacterium GW2011_GWF2_33_92]KKP82462.1 MAG: hypothetical protein UR84_C0003G0014 [candidate division WS6 bacterium 
MKMLKTITLLITIIIFVSPVYAQEFEIEDVTQSTVVEDEDNNTVKSTNSYFELELKRGVQNPLNKEIPLTLYITPKIDSPKTQILWNIPSTFGVDIKHSEFVDLNKDQTYSFSIDVKPERTGSYGISVNVISWQFDTNLTNTVSSTITLSKSLIVQPVDPEFTLISLLLLLAFLLVSGIGIYLLVKISKKLLIKLKIWLTPPV